MARREIVPAKQEKAFQRVRNFRKEISEYKQQFVKLKGERADAVWRNPIARFRPSSNDGVILGAYRRSQ